jgi:RNA polymerase sigma factor (TIGR02999 family)
MSEEIAFPSTTDPGNHPATLDEQWGHYSADALLPLVYSELRRLAAGHLANESPGQTLQAIALVHEAYLRLIAAGRGKEWRSRGHFFGAAAEAMRRILVDKARRKATAKWGRAGPSVFR